VVICNCPYKGSCVLTKQHALVRTNDHDVQGATRACNLRRCGTIARRGMGSCPYGAAQMMPGACCGRQCRAWPAHGQNMPCANAVQEHSGLHSRPVPTPESQLLPVMLPPKRCVLYADPLPRPAVQVWRPASRCGRRSRCCWHPSSSPCSPRSTRCAEMLPDGRA